MLARAWIHYVICVLVLSQEGLSKSRNICPKELPLSSEPKCKGVEKLTCRSGIPASFSKKEHLKVKSLSICHWQEATLSLKNITARFPNLTKLAIRGGNVSLIEDAIQASKIETLILSDLPLSDVTEEIFSGLKHLKVLDLSNNELEEMDRGVISTLPHATKVYLGGNPWHCSLNISWMMDKPQQRRIADWQNMTCGSPYPGKPVAKVLPLLQKMVDECPWDICSCSMHHIVWDKDTRSLRTVIAVNCSHRGLQRMPEVLPSNTTILYLGHNNISDLAPLVRSNVYKHVSDVYLDHNRINSLDELEGAEWLKTFRVFSVYSNILSEVPTYALDNAFERNQNLAKVYFGANPWTCNCEFTPGFQHLLIKYQSVVRDQHEIKCRETENDEHSLMHVMELTKGSVCYEAGSSINPLDILSGVLAILIVLVLGKLFYDYWYFKRTGKLPWIVAKMP